MIGMGIRLQRHLGDAEDVDPGQWCNDITRHTPGQMATVLIGCPLCGTCSDLTSMHKVASGGEVSPAFACTNGACSFLEYIVLSGWGEPT